MYAMIHILHAFLRKIACFAVAALLTVAAGGAPSPVQAQSPALMKAQSAQAETQKQAVAKRQHRERRKALEAAGLSDTEIEDLIATLESPDARDRLITRLKGLRAATAKDAASPAGATPGKKDGGIRNTGDRVVSLVSQRIDMISGELVSGAGLLLDVPRIFAWLERQYDDPAARDAWLRVLWKVILVLVAGFAAELLLRWLLARPRAAIEIAERESVWLRVLFLFARTLLDILPIVAFGGAAYIVLALIDPAESTRLIAIALVNASVISRAIMAAARMFFAPKVSNLRVLTLSDESATYFVIWTRRFTNLVVYGFFLAEAALLLGLPAGGYIALTKAIGLLITLLLMIFVLQNRRMVADVVRGEQEKGSVGVRMLRRRFADIWHVLAIIYVFALFLVWALEIKGGFEFVFQATVLSVVILFVAKLVIIGSHHGMEVGFGIRPEVMAKFSGLAFRANRYFAIVHYVIHGLVIVLAIFALLEAWGIDAFAWVGTPVGQHVTGSVVSIVFVAVLSILIWEMVSSVIERYLSRDENGDEMVSARAKTLLPLLRKAALIVIATISGFIILAQIGVNIGPLLAGAGVVGLAIGFGSQTLVKDVITGLFILAEDQFSVGDVVRVSDKAGLVEAITIRTIRLRDLSGNVHMIPFSSVNTVENMTKDFSRYVFDVGIAYREDVDEVIEVLKALGEEMQADTYYGELITLPLEILGLNEFGDSAIVIRARFTTRPIKQWEVGREFNRRIKRRFDELGIEIPFPHQTVYFGESKGGGAPPAFVRLEGAPTDPSADASSPDRSPGSSDDGAKGT